MSTTPTGIAIIGCMTCGRPHPKTRTHCSTCGRAHLFTCKEEKQ